jgi:hypothetical protein
MRRRSTAISALLSIFLLALTVPVASAGAVRTDFVGFVFPAGYLDAGASCPYTWVAQPLPGCVVDPGTTTMLADKRALIRNEVFFDLAYGYHTLDDALNNQAQPNEPRRTGYNVETFNANFDATLSGPAWGSWEFYSFTNELMFRGTFTGRFTNGAASMRINGIGVGTYAGQHVWLDVLPGQYVNVAGTFLEPGSVADAH